MPRTCSRMKPSASPKPASGPVFGLTCPILMVRLWALAGITRNTAGAVMAPISVRREMLESGCDVGTESFGMCVSLLVTTPGSASAIACARLFQMLQHFCPQRRLLLGRPLAKPFARLEAELLLRHQPFEIGRR